MRYLSLIFGTVIAALGYAVFLIPHSIVPGGISGIAIVMHILLKTPVGIMVIILNLPLFIIAMRILGIPFGVKSIVVIVAMNLLIDLLVYTTRIPTPTESAMLASLYGGVMLGVGLGLIFRGGANTGGSDIIGQILNRYTNMSVGMWIFVVDFVVITFAGFATHSVEKALYGYVALFISTKVVDLMLEGMDYARALFIISDKTDAVVKAIYEQTGRGLTLLDGFSPYSKGKKPVIFCVITKRETDRFKTVVKNVDQEAFVILTNVFEVLGKGFRTRV